MAPFGLSKERFDYLNKAIKETYTQGLADAKSNLDSITSEFMKRELDEHVQRVISFNPLLTLQNKFEFEVTDEKLIPAINGYIAAQAKKLWASIDPKEFDGSRTICFASPRDLSKKFREMFKFSVDDLEQHDVIDSILSYVDESIPRDISIDMAIEQLLLHIRTLDFDDEMKTFFKSIQSDKWVLDFEEQLYWLESSTFYDLIIRPYINDLIDENIAEIKKRINEII